MLIRSKERGSQNERQKQDMSMSEVEGIVRKCIDELADNAPAQWEGHLYGGVKLIEIDNRGDVGELIVVNMLKALGREDVSYSKGTTHEEKDWDFMCGEYSYEVKTATLGKDGITFQHEGIEKTRQYDGLIFVDIAPDEIFISGYCKKDIPWYELHRRANSTAYKWNTNIKETRKHCVKQNKVVELLDFAKIFERLETRIRNSQTKNVSDL